jgi:glutamate--cysteine ligase
MVKDWTDAERQALRDAVPRDALAAPFRGETVRDIARRALDLAARGLERRARLDSAGHDERIYLAPLEVIVEEGRTEAERLLALYGKEWGGQVDPVFGTNRV